MAYNYATFIRTPQFRMVLAMSLLFGMPYAASMSCPDECDCKIKNDLPIASCDISDTSLLKNLPADIVELNLSGNKFDDSTYMPHFASLEKLSLANCNLNVVSLELSNLAKLHSLDLTGNRLTMVPTGLPSTLTSLHLSRNKISIVEAEEFSDLKTLQELFLDKNQLRIIDINTFICKMNSEYRATPQHKVLEHLRKLVLNSNKIESISEKAFAQMTNLFALNLANNRISSIDRSTFTGLRNLQHLDLTKNRISSIEDGAFEHLTELNYLSLKHNRLSTVPQGIPMLEWLDISYNLIKHIPEEFKPTFYSIEVLNFGQNPFHCDCHLLWLKEFHDRREYLVKHLEIDPYEFIPTCSSPEKLLGESWDVLSEDLFTCNVPTDMDGSEHKSIDASQFKVSVKEISDTFINLDWSIKGSAAPVPTIVIQYYEFGRRGATFKNLELSIIQKGYTVKHLKPETNYVICITPKMEHIKEISTVTPLSLDHCVEVTTIRTQSIHILSYFGIFCYYILASVGTILFLLIFIGAVALIGSVFMKGNDWSSKYVAIDEPIRDEDEEDIDQSQLTKPNDIDQSKLTKQKDVQGGKLHND